MTNPAHIAPHRIRDIFAGAAFILGLCACAGVAGAASTPSLSLTNSGSSVNISVTHADPNVAVMFSYSNSAVSPTFTSIDIGHTDSNGSYSVAVAPNSYGLNGGSPVYVTVDGSASPQASWPASVQSGTGLSLSQQDVSLAKGQAVNIFALNSSNTLSVSHNTNPSVVSASIQSNTLFLNALQGGTSDVTVCASTDGCGTVNVSVQSNSQTVSFGQTQAYVTVGQTAQPIAIYGPGTYYGLSNSNEDVASATVSGTSLILTGRSVGKSTISLCASGWGCGTIAVSTLSPGSALPTVSNAPAPDLTGLPPQLSSISISSNDVYGSFFGANSTLTINFSSNESVTNVQATVAGTQVTVNQGVNGLYSVSYKLTGNETLPLPVAVSFANSSGQRGQAYFWIGDSASGMGGAASSSSGAANAASYSFSGYLYKGMTPLGQTNADVYALQQRLKTDGIYSGPITGYFGDQTKTALESYQKAHGLDAIGVVGPSTRALLNKGI